MGEVADDRPAPSTVIEWGSAGLAFGDEGDGRESGDRHVIVPFPEAALVAVIDGLGHGAEAAIAARAAARLVEDNARGSVVTLTQRCHEGLRRTRGVVMSLAWFGAEESSMTWLGVGNVRALLLRADPAANPPRESLTARGGVLGYQLPPLRAATLAVSPGDTLIMATDGIRADFTSVVSTAPPPQELADAILARHRKHSDDALVLVARYAGMRA
jgi:serine phosphatase RsbU (regulator of sigma subunit)